MTILGDCYKKAKEEGRLCISCGWIVTKKDFKSGERKCFNCRDAEKGVIIHPLIDRGNYLDEPEDMTGEML